QLQTAHLRPAGNTFGASESLPASQPSPNRTFGTTHGRARSIRLEGKNRAKVARDFAPTSPPLTAPSGLEIANPSADLNKRRLRPPAVWLVCSDPRSPFLLCQNYFSLRCLF